MGENIHGQHIIAGESTRWHPVGVTQRPDGKWALMIDSELQLDGSNVSISNIKVGSVDQTTGTLRYLKTLDDGSLVISTQEENPFAGYNVSRTTDGAFPRYYGLTDKNENWIIIKEGKSGSDSDFTYFKGVNGFLNAWTAKASHAYDEYYNIF